MSLPTTRLPDTRKLRHVVAVATAGSFTGATQLLSITQSALTKSVAELEDQLGYSLFERLPRGVRLTAPGASFVPRAERLLADMGDLMAGAGEIADLQAGRLRLGVGPTAFMTFLEKGVPAFARLYPGVEIEVRAGTIDEMARALINREIDLVVGAANYLTAWHELETVSVGTLETFFIGRKGHPAGEDPDAPTLLEYPVILPATGLSTAVNLAGAYRAVGLSPRPPHYICDHFPMVLDLVKKTDAISPVVTLGDPGARFRSSYSVYDGVIHLEAHELGYAMTSSGALAPPALAFIDLFRSLLTGQLSSIV